MKHHAASQVFAALLLCLASPRLHAESPTGVDPQADWPGWRGPSRDGVANSDQQPPTSWSESENVLWSAALPGRGHGSPIVVGNQVVIAAADVAAQRQELVCLDRRTGATLWRRTVHDGEVVVKGNKKASLASSTAACDGERLFINFLNGGAVYTSAVQREDGELLWQTKLTDYTVHQGYGSSPTLHGDLVIVSADNKGGGVIAALNRKTGAIAWRRQRPKKPNYTSPVVLRLFDKDQLVMTGCNLVTSLDPLTGEVLWETEGATTECVTTTVTDGQRIFTSGGYPKNHISAVLADGSGKVQWEDKSRVYVPSMLLRDGHLYAVLDQGIAACWKSDSGEQLWKQRLGGSGAYSASPVMVGELIYAVGEDGLTSVFKARPEGFELISQNALGDFVMATPAICGGRIYLRVAENDQGALRERLYCLASRP